VLLPIPPATAKLGGSSPSPFRLLAPAATPTSISRSVLRPLLPGAALASIEPRALFADCCPPGIHRARPPASDRHHVSSASEDLPIRYSLKR